MEANLAVSPKGLSIQTMYRDYRDGRLIVNRQYQRKLVWTVSEKVKLIDSIMLNYPIPLILLAEKPTVDGAAATLEVIDGMQRLNAIFSFIEHGFEVDGKCFDLDELPRARQASEQGLFPSFGEDIERISPEACADFLDYQLAVTAFSGEDEARITDIFGRINSGGKQLSDQERRQAGVLTPFANMVREVSAELRGDVSKEQLTLYEMPEISIETQKNPHGYKLKAEDIFWCRQGIMRTNELRDSDDEEMMIDVCASILNGSPVDGSRAYRDSLYAAGTDNAKEINKKLNAYGTEKLQTEVKLVFSALRAVVEGSSEAANHFRTTVYATPTSNSQKSPFYAVFMAFFDLIVKETKYPDLYAELMGDLANIAQKISVGQKQTKAKDRKTNVNQVKGLIRDRFVASDVAAFSHGPGLILEFENSIARSKTETSRYEFKQGILRLDDGRGEDPNIFKVMLETICGIANLGPAADGYLYVGIADRDEHAKRITALDAVEPLRVRHVNVVGVEREAKVLGIEMDAYQKKFEDFISNSDLSEPLKNDVSTCIDTVTYKELEIMRIRIPAQKTMSFVGDDAFYRVGSSTKKATGPEIAALANKF